MVFGFEEIDVIACGVVTAEYGVRYMGDAHYMFIRGVCVSDSVPIDWICACF